MLCSLSVGFGAGYRSDFELVEILESAIVFTVIWWSPECFLIDWLWYDVTMCESRVDTYFFMVPMPMITVFVLALIDDIFVWCLALVDFWFSLPVPLMAGSLTVLIFM